MDNWYNNGCAVFLIITDWILPFELITKVWMLRCYSEMMKVHKMIIAKTNYRNTQNEPSIIKTVHLTDVNVIPPDVSEPLDIALETSTAAGVLYIRSSVSIHSGNSAKNIVKKQMKII